MLLARCLHLFTSSLALLVLGYALSTSPALASEYWQGTVERPGAESYPLVVRFDGERAKAFYGGRNCRAEWHLVAKRDGPWEMRERITTGKERCIDAGHIKITRLNNGRLKYEWRRQRRGKIEATSTLSQKQGLSAELDGAAPAADKNSAQRDEVPADVRQASDNQTENNSSSDQEVRSKEARPIVGYWDGKIECAERKTDLYMYIWPPENGRYTAHVATFKPWSRSGIMSDDVFVGEAEKGGNELFFARTGKRLHIIDGTNITSFKIVDRGNGTSAVEFPSTKCGPTTLSRLAPNDEQHNSLLKSRGSFWEAKDKKGRCIAVSEWAKPFLRKGGSRSINHAMAFVDQVFVPVFGRSYDSWNWKERLEFSRKYRLDDLCDDDPILKARYGVPNDLFIAFSQNPHITGYIEWFARRSRIASRVVSSQLERQSAAASETGKSVISELSAYAAENRDFITDVDRIRIQEALAAPGGVEARSSDLGGRWDGVAVCSGRTQAVSLFIESLGVGEYNASLNAFRTIDFQFAKIDNDSYEVRTPNVPINKTFRIQTTEGMPPTIKIHVGGGCRVAFLIRHEPISGLGGLYSKTKQNGQASAFSQSEFCKNVVGGWFAEERRLYRSGVDLKERLYPALQSYDVGAASTSAILRGDLFQKFFGMPVNRLEKNRFDALMAQVKGCILTQEYDGETEPTYGTQLYTPRSIVFSLQEVIRSTFDGRKFVPAAGFQVMKNASTVSPLKKFKDVFPNWPSDLASATSPDDLEAIVRSSAPKLTEVDPAESHPELTKAADRLAALRVARVAKDDEERRARARALLAASDIPFNSIDERFHALLKELAEGEPVNLDDATRLVMGGAATEIHRSCKPDLSTEDAAVLWPFLKSSAERAVFGSDYSNSDLGRAFGNRASGLALFSSGEQLAKAFACAKPSVDGLLTLIIDAVRSNTRSADGGAALFVRTCGQKFTAAQCECLAKVGSASIPNIHQERYSREIIGQLIRSSPVAGLQIAGLCQIVRY